MAQAGQNTWKSQARGPVVDGVDVGKNFIVQATIEKNMHNEYREYSALGQLAKPVKGRMINDKQMRDIDVGQSSIIVSKTITSGNECRLSLVRNITGATTFGDTPVADGDSLAYMHASFFLNKSTSPAFQLTEEMEKMKAQDLVAGEESELRNQMTFFFGEEYTHEAYRGFMKGRSLNLGSPTVDGGLALDMGRGPGAALSPSRVVVIGQGQVTEAPTSTKTDLDAYEVAVAASLDGMLADIDTNPLNGRIEKKIVTEMRNYVIKQKIKGIMVGGKQKWYVMCDPAIITDLTKEGGELWEAWKISLHHDKNSEIYNGVGHIELEDFIFVKDPYMSQFRPQIDTTANAGVGAVKLNSDGSVLLGCEEERNPRQYVAAQTDVIAPMLILGEHALFEANNGKLEVMKETGKFEQGASIAGKIKQAFQRSRFLPKDGSTEKELNQSMAMFFVHAPEAFDSFNQVYAAP